MQSVSMLFSVDGNSGDLEDLPERALTELGFLERQDLQEWIIAEPRILGEDLLIITSEYANFENTHDRLDILALDPTGKVVVVELKRDRADRTTDLQAIKYASYCSTLTAEDLQKEYREFWNGRDETDRSPEEVGETFMEFLNEYGGDITIGNNGWATFNLDQKPRILLAAGSFGLEITAPTMWLIEEYGLDITCTKIEAHEHKGRILLNSQQVIPISEAEEYMTRRREKQERQSGPSDYRTTLDILLEEGVLERGDRVYFDQEQVPDTAERDWSEDEEFWWATVTGETGQRNNVRWEHDSEEYSFTGLSKEILHKLVGRDKDNALNGYKYWRHPNYGDRTLYELRDEDISAADRDDEATVLPPE